MRMMNITIKLSICCHKCDATTEMDVSAMNRIGWDAPVFIRQGDNAWLQTQYCPRHARWWTLQYWARRFEWRIGRITRRLSPGMGSCYRCKTTWDFVHGHTTNYGGGSGCFPLCEKCWEGLMPEQRLPYYRQLYDEWVKQGRDSRDWGEIEFAVLNEGVDEWPDTIG